MAKVNQSEIAYENQGGILKRFKEGEVLKYVLYPALGKCTFGSIRKMYSQMTELNAELECTPEGFKAMAEYVGSNTVIITSTKNAEKITFSKEEFLKCFDEVVKLEEGEEKHISFVIDSCDRYGGYRNVVLKKEGVFVESIIDEPNKPDTYNPDKDKKTTKVIIDAPEQ